MKFNKITTLSLGALLLSSNFSFASLEDGKKGEGKTSRDPFQGKSLYGKNKDQQDFFERVKIRQNKWIEFIQKGDLCGISTPDFAQAKDMYRGLSIEAKRNARIHVVMDLDSPPEAKQFVAQYGKKIDEGANFIILPPQIDKFLNDERSPMLKGTFSFQAKGEMKDFAPITGLSFRDEPYDHILRSGKFALATGTFGEVWFDSDRGEIFWQRDNKTGRTMIANPALAGAMLRELPISAKVGLRFEGNSAPELIENLKRRGFPVRYDYNGDAYLDDVPTGRAFDVLKDSKFPETGEVYFEKGVIPEKKFWEIFTSYWEAAENNRPYQGSPFGNRAPFSTDPEVFDAADPGKAFDLEMTLATALPPEPQDKVGTGR